MAQLARSLILGYGGATAAAIWLAAIGYGIWAVIAMAWIGGAVLSLAIAFLATYGSSARIVRAGANDKAKEHENEYAQWDQDLMAEFFAKDLEDDKTGQQPANSRRA